MSQEQYDEIQVILQKITQLEDELKVKGQEIDNLKTRLDELLLYGFAPINAHIKKWDKRDLYIFRTQRFIKRFIYSPIHLGARTTIAITVRLILTLLTGIIAGILLNLIGIGSLLKNIISLFDSLFG